MQITPFIFISSALLTACTSSTKSSDSGADQGSTEPVEHRTIEVAGVKPPTHVSETAPMRCGVTMPAPALWAAAPLPTDKECTPPQTAVKTGTR